LEGSISAFIWWVSRCWPQETTYIGAWTVEIRLIWGTFDGQTFQLFLRSYLRSGDLGNYLSAFIYDTGKFLSYLLVFLVN